ncbi:MAG: radical SAM protein, partial [Paludibacteraceae bacterium]|nr:radical SAM protein [Paludibacteraceae bacterium]
MSYKVNEIFYSLQGEGLHTGEPAIFIRFSGCNLACPWCDTDHKAFTEMTAEQITSKCNHYPAQLVVLTGGEPALQADDALIAALHDAGYYIAIETNGTHSLPDDIDWVTCSPKEGSHVVLSEADEVKIVYT